MNFSSLFDPSTTLGAFLISFVAGIITGFITGCIYQEKKLNKLLAKTVEGDVHQSIDGASDRMKTENATESEEIQSTDVQNSQIRVYNKKNVATILTNNGMIFQDSSLSLAPAISLRIAKDNPALIQAHMDDIASALKEEGKDNNIWVLKKGKAVLKKEPRPIVFHEEKELGPIIEAEEKKWFEKWIKDAVDPEDIEPILLCIRNDKPLDLKSIRLKQPNFLKKCEFGVQKIKGEEKLHDMVFYDNLYIINLTKNVLGAEIVSTINADRGFQFEVVKREDGKIFVKYNFNPTTWDELKIFSKFNKELKEEAIVYLRGADDNQYMFRKTMIPEENPYHNVFDCEETLSFIEDVEMIQNQLNVEFDVKEMDDIKYDFIRLFAASMNNRLSEYNWEKGDFLFEPNKDLLKKLIRYKKDEEIKISFSVKLKCDFKNVKFDGFNCNHIIDSARIENYDDVQRLYREGKYPIRISIAPKENNKMYRILDIPGINLNDRKEPRSNNCKN